MTVSAHTLTATLEDGTVLSTEDGTITLDEGWAPYAQVTLNCPAASLPDPRDGVRVRLVARQDFGDSDTVATLTAQWHGKHVSDVTAAYTGLHLFTLTSRHYRAWNSFGVRASTRRTFDLGLRSRRRTHKADTSQATLASDEALLQDFALVATAPYQPANTSVRSLVRYVLGLLGFFLAPGTDDGVITPDASTWLPGVKAWSYLAPLVQQAGLRLWCDEKRVWRLTASTVSKPGTVVLSYLNTITDAEDEIDRDGDWYDAVVITYTWTNDLGLQQTAYDVASVEGFSKVLPLSYDTPYPGPGAASVVLARALGFGEVQTITAISDYTAEPGMADSITIGADEFASGVVSSVVWAFPGDEMTVKSRGLIEVVAGAWSRQPVGLKWSDVPHGRTWSTGI